MPEAVDHFSESGRGINSYCVEKDTDKPLLSFYQENYMVGKYYMTDNITLDDSLLRSDGTQHATEKNLRIFWNINTVYAGLD